MMKISVQVKVTKSGGYTDLNNLFCQAINGQLGHDPKNPESTKKLQKILDDAFDNFAQVYFDAGRKWQKENDKF